jgi:hypothetical protein
MYSFSRITSALSETISRCDQGIANDQFALGGKAMLEHVLADVIRHFGDALELLRSDEKLLETLVKSAVEYERQERLRS